MIESRQVPLLLFAKAPVAGMVKTRLRPSCSAKQAADIAKILLEESVDKCVQAWPGEVKLLVWPDRSDPFFAYIKERYSIEIVLQANGGLGDKMTDAFDVFGYPAAIMGCDVPHLPGSTLVRAHQALSENKNIIAPSIDGGYYLVGLSQTSSGIFKGIEWGGNRVFADTQLLAVQHKVHFETLPILNDIDTWQDVLDVAGELPSLLDYITRHNLLRP